MPLTLQIVTAEKTVFDDTVDIVTAPGEEGQMGILPEHAALLSGLVPGELRYRRGSEEVSLVIGGGFIEVLNDKVIVLADTAERSDEIDVARAEQARQKAIESLQNKGSLDEEQLQLIESSLRRAIARIDVANRRRGGGRGGTPRLD